MSKTNKRRVFAEPQVFSAQEFEASGIRELSFEELLEVNGGKQVKDDPRTDKNSDTCPHSSNTPRESSSSGSGASSGSSSSSGSSGSYSSGSSGASNASGGSSASSGSNKEEERSPTQGGGAPHAEISSPSGGSSSGAESAGTNTGSSGSSSAGGSSGGGGSFDRDSPERDRDSDRDSGSWSGNYTPSGQSQESPKPNKGEEKSPTQGGGAPCGEAATTGRNHGKNTGAINSGTTGGVLSGFKEFWGNAGNSVGKAVRGVKDTVGDRLTRLNKKIEEETTNSSNNSQPINDFKLPEKRKRESAVYMSFDKSEETLKITSYRMLANGDWQPTHVTTISARNHVRNELNNLRKTPDATTFPLDGSESQWYFPRQFPNGVWECRTSRISTNPDISGVFIPTNAFQDVPVYGPKSQEKPTPNLDGNYIPTGIQTDTGYGIHFAPNGTWGCIGLESKQDAAWLANKIDVALESSNGFALLRVKD